MDGLYLFGIPITRPERGYGYVEQATELADHPGVAPVKRFHEKPDRERALDYAKRPEMLWNSGIFLWKSTTILDALERHIPETRDELAMLRDALRREKGRFGPAASKALDRYLEVSPAVSVDTAVLEKHDKAYVTRATFRWSDLGGWPSWGEQLEPDREGNRGQGHRILHDTHDCTVYSEDGLVALLGVKDLIVVRLKDVTMVCSKDRAQEIRQLVQDVGSHGDLEEYL
jgi:mannose-1-phosphate guanylyltransferase